MSTCRCYVVVGWPDMDPGRQARGRDRCCYVVVGWPCLTYCCYVVVGWSDMDSERQARGRDR